MDKVKKRYTCGGSDTMRLILMSLMKVIITGQNTWKIWEFLMTIRWEMKIDLIISDCEVIFFLTLSIVKLFDILIWHINGIITKLNCLSLGSDVVSEHILLNIFQEYEKIFI